ncbi:hypothetical protein ABZ619_18115 [Streptomyces sp. NPDC007851]|uniref:hypothetical protein n=1 Tax=Streptomyces sp. NPDC007851 TaxID=3155008 RepID=UPI0033C15534
MGDETPRTAFEDPDTLRAWQQAQRRSTAALTFWGLSLPGFFVLATLLWESLVGGSLPIYVIAPLVLVSAVGIGLSERRRSHVKQMKGILAVYPWQYHPPLKSVHPGDVAHFQLPDPDALNKKVSVIALRYGLGMQWRAAMTEARAQGFTLAGDPRFGVVLSPRGQSKLIAVQPKNPQLTSGRPNGVDEASWQQAKTAGIAH